MSFPGPPPPPDGYDRPLDYPEDAGLPPPVYPAPHPGLPGSGYHAHHVDPSGYVTRQQPPPGTNGKAIGAIVAAVTGLACCLPALAGLALGLIAMTETKRTGQSGHSLATAAVIISGIVIVGYVVYIVVFAVVSGVSNG